MSKKLLVVLLSFLMLFSMFPGTVFAQNIEEDNFEEDGLPAVEEPVEKNQTEEPVISQEVTPQAVQLNEAFELGHFEDRYGKYFEYTEEDYRCSYFYVNVDYDFYDPNKEHWVTGAKFGFNSIISSQIIIPPYSANGSGDDFHIDGPVIGGSFRPSDAADDISELFISENFTQETKYSTDYTNSTKIGNLRPWENPFYTCKSLKKIYVDSRNPVYFSDEYGVLYRWMNPADHDEGAALVCFPRNIQGLTDGAYKIPDNVVLICKNAFYQVKNVFQVGMPNFITLVIPSSVTRIESNDFSNCEDLKLIVFGGNASSLGKSNMFYKYPSSAAIQIVYKYGASGFDPDGLHPEYDFESWNGAKINPNVARIDVPSNKVISAGGSVNLTANIFPKNAYFAQSDYVISWASSNTGAATVARYGQDSNNTSTGRVTVPSGGTGKTTITARSVSDMFYRYFGTEQVTAKCEIEIGTPVTGVTLPTTRDVYTGETSQLSPTFIPSNPTNKNVTWSSDNEAVATVSESGLVTAKSAGSATITVKTEDGGHEATCSVTVINRLVTGVTLNKPATSIKVGEEERLIATVSPTNAFNKNVIWSSNNESVAIVSQDGLVIAKKAGSAIITVTTEDGGHKAACSVTVSNVQVTKVILTPTEVTLKVGEQQQLTASVEPSNATNKKIIYEIYDSYPSNVIEISEDGLITATGVGTAYIMGKAEDGYNGTEYAICKVTVKKTPVTGVSFESGVVELKVGQKYQLEPIIIPANATDKEVWYHFLGSGNITVSNTGLVEANGVGETLITVYTSDGGFSSQCRVIVPAVKVEKISLNHES